MPYRVETVGFHGGAAGTTFDERLANLLNDRERNNWRMVSMASFNGDQGVVVILHKDD